MQLTSLKPPSAYVQEKLGPQLTALGAKVVDNDDMSAVEVRFADAKTTTVANAAFEDSIDGIKLIFQDADGNGVRGVANGYDVLDAVAKIPGVTSTVAMETMPLQMRITTDSAATRTALETLLRDQTAGGDSIGISGP